MTPTLLSHLDGAAWHHGGWSPWPWFPFVALAAWSALALVAASYLQRRRRSPAGGGHQALAERYARGEIDDDEYRHRLAVLEERGR